MFQTPDLARLRRLVHRKAFGFYDATVDGGWDVPGEPYVRASEEAAGRFEWCGAHAGWSHHHWAISLRYGPYDFKPHSGMARVDWPWLRGHRPYYDKVELLIAYTAATRAWRTHRILTGLPAAAPSAGQ